MGEGTSSVSGGKKFFGLKNGVALRSLIPEGGKEERITASTGDIYQQKLKITGFESTKIRRDMHQDMSAGSYWM